MVTLLFNNRLLEFTRLGRPLITGVKLREHTAETFLFVFLLQSSLGFGLLVVACRRIHDFLRLFFRCRKFTQLIDRQSSSHTRVIGEEFVDDILTI